MIMTQGWLLLGKKGVYILLWMRNYWSGRNYQIMRSKLPVKIGKRARSQMGSTQAKKLAFHNMLPSWPVQGNNYWCWRGCVCSSSCVVKMNRIQPRPSFDLEKRGAFFAAVLMPLALLGGAGIKSAYLLLGFNLLPLLFRVYASDIVACRHFASNNSSMKIIRLRTLTQRW